MLDLIILRDFSTEPNYCKVYNFTDKSFTYLGKIVMQSFQSILIDNIGNGKISITINRPTMDICNPQHGVKTLLSKDTLYLESEIDNISIYYHEPSEVEIILEK